ncbi:MAG: adenylate/guanylate cyclase domain-containing protein [Candidatus Binatia bacterium]|nr:adenylate/guanylate cyclase domain-containing protein [Candidatus Binatia bacterium]
MPTVVLGANVTHRGLPQSDLLCGIFLLTYFLIFAYAAYTRTMQLIRSRRELREQKAIAEIERTRSESLLSSLIPSTLKKQFREQGLVPPERYEHATLVVVDFVDLDSVSEQNPLHDWFGVFNHHLQAFDAIAARYGLESLRACGRLYCAVSGALPVTAEHADDAIGAAVEMRGFARDFSKSQHESSSPTLAVRIAVHTGRVVAGVTEARRFVYNVCGPGWSEALRICESIEPWDIGVSETTRGRLTHALPMKPSGAVPLAVRGSLLPVYVLTDNAVRSSPMVG